MDGLQQETGHQTGSTCLMFGRRGRRGRASGHTQSVSHELSGLKTRTRTERASLSSVPLPSQLFQQPFLFIHEYRYSCRHSCAAVFKSAGAHLSGEVRCSFGRQIVFQQLFMWTNEQLVEEAHLTVRTEILHIFQEGCRVFHVSLLFVSLHA